MKRKKKRYRAIIIDLRKVLKVTGIFCGILFISFVLFFNLSHTKEKIPEVFSGLSQIISEKFANYEYKNLENILKREMPFFKVIEKAALEDFSEKAEPVYNPENADMGEAEEPLEEENRQYEIKEIDSSQAKSLSGTKKKILIKNETAFNVDVSSMLKEGFPFKIEKGAPQILIIHTHATESYANGESWTTSKSDRNNDTEKNVVKVGEKMAEIFRENGIETLHIKTLHDYPNYNGSYQNSLKSAEDALKKYPSIKMIIDVHRDAIIYSDGSKAKVLCEIGGKKAAQLMFVIGTDASGLNHPAWRKNLSVAVKLQSSLEETYPGLMRGINLRKERFNGHLTAGSMILEVGTSANTLDEALYSAGLFANVVANTIK